jgi:argininosuccinate synthase
MARGRSRTASPLPLRVKKIIKTKPNYAIKFSQRQVEGKVSLVAYKGNAYVVGRSSETSNLYSEDESSMDTLDMNWTPQDTTGFIAIQGIRLEKYGARKIKDGEPLAP